MIQINNLADCCGCTACNSICTHDAIKMVPDALGFLYPKVDKNKCVECGLCEKVCAFNSHYDTGLNLGEPLTYAVRHKSIKEINTSRSGAAFIALSDWVLEQGGILFMEWDILSTFGSYISVQQLKKNEMSLREVNMSKAI